MMEEEEGNGEDTPPLEPRRHELLAAAVGEDNTPAAAVSTHMNFEGRREIYFSTTTRPFRWWRKVISRGVCRSGGHQPADAPKYYGPFIGECSRCSSTISRKQSSSRSSTGRAKCGVTVRRQTQ